MILWPGTNQDMLNEAERLARVFDARTEDSHDIIDAATLLPKLIELAKDAARYRWLRANTTDQIPYRGWWEIAGGAGAVPERLDAAIDKAMQTAEGDTKGTIQGQAPSGV
jgi:hypothetical protein